MSFSLSLPAAAGIEGPVVDVAVQSGKSGKTESPTLYPTAYPTIYPTFAQCTKPSGKSGKAGNGELYCLDEDCGKCAALEANFIATKCPELIATFPPCGGNPADQCVALDVAKDFLFCSAICETSLVSICAQSSPELIPTVGEYCLGFNSPVKPIQPCL